MLKVALVSLWIPYTTVCYRHIALNGALSVLPLLSVPQVYYHYEKPISHHDEHSTDHHRQTYSIHDQIYDNFYSLNTEIFSSSPQTIKSCCFSFLFFSRFLSLRKQIFLFHLLFFLASTGIDKATAFGRRRTQRYLFMLIITSAVTQSDLDVVCPLNKCGISKQNKASLSSWDPGKALRVRNLWREAFVMTHDSRVVWVYRESSLKERTHAHHTAEQLWIGQPQWGAFNWITE